MAVFDVKMFNRCYVTWMKTVLKVTGSTEILEKCDAICVAELGRQMAIAIKASDDPGPTDPIERWVWAIRQTHWFQEDVVIERRDEKFVLYPKTCTFQNHWKKTFGAWHPYCVGPHQGFIEAFSTEMTLPIKATLTHNPKEDGVCRFEIVLERVEG